MPLSPRRSAPSTWSRSRRSGSEPGGPTETEPRPEESTEMSSTYAVVNPATGEQIKEYAEMSDAELGGAIDKAWDAVKDWSAKTTVAERAAMIRRVGELH